MKKFAVSLLVAVLAALGLVGSTSTSAQAYECPYTGCFGTSTSVRGPDEARAGTRPRFVVMVEALGSNVAVQGRVKLTFTKAATGRTARGKTTSAAYDGLPVRLRPDGALGRGVWVVTARFRSADGPFYPSQDFTTIRMVKRG